jgi:aminoglycoside phosphotransferase (APT) family kinase protein
MAGRAPAGEDERTRVHRLVDGMLAGAAQRTRSWRPHPIFRDAACWCKANAPDGDQDGMVVVHGDFKVGNLIWRDERIQAFLDWEGALVGDPLQDLGYACDPAMREPQPHLMAAAELEQDLLSRAVERSGMAATRRL